MTSIELLQKLQSILLNKYNAGKNKLSDVSDRACEDNDIKYNDFDKISDATTKEIGIPSVPSCDSLVFKEKSIIFIEFKHFTKGNEDEQKDFFDTLHAKAYKKVTYSKKTLLYIVTKVLGNKEQEDYKNIGKEYYIVGDKSPISKFGFTAILNILSSPTHNIRIKYCNDMEEISKNMI